MAKPKFYKALLEQYERDFPEGLLAKEIFGGDFSKAMIQLVDDISGADGIKSLMDKTEVEERLEEILINAKEKYGQNPFTNRDLQIRVLVEKIRKNYEQNIKTKGEIDRMGEELTRMKRTMINLQYNYDDDECDWW